ncbi:type II secretion system protein GspN, partial [Thermodesulfobacteriota bacterium]
IDRSIWGLLSGTATFSSKGLIRSGSAKLSLSDCRVTLISPLIPVDQLTFENVETELGLNNRKFEIKKCNLKGQQVNGTITGFVTLNNPIGKSRLNLNGIIKPHHVFLAELKKNLPANLLPKKRPGAGGFRIRLKGTIEAPGFDFY